MERYLFKGKKKANKKENHLTKFISITFALIGSVTVLEFLESDRPILSTTAEQVPAQVMETLNSMRDDLVSFRPGI